MTVFGTRSSVATHRRRPTIIIITTTTTTITITEGEWNVQGFRCCRRIRYVYYVV